MPPQPPSGPCSHRLLLCAVLMTAGALCWGCGNTTGIPSKEAKRIRAQFTQGLANTDPYVRAETVRAMGIIGSPELADLLNKATQDSDPMVKAGATIGLAKVQPKDAQSLLTDIVASASPETSRAVLRTALFHMPLSDARSDILDIALRSQDPYTRRVTMQVGVAAEAVQTHNPKYLKERTLPRLSRLVDHSDPLVAGLALRMIEKLGRDDRVAPLVEDATQGSGDRQLRALYVLTEAALTKYKAHFAKVDTSGGGALAGAVAMGRVSTGDASALDGVRDVLTGASPEITGRALRALSHCESEDAYRMMRTYREDSSPEIRAEAFRQMGNHPAAEGKDFKRGMRDDDLEVVIATLQGIAKGATRYLAPYAERALANSSRQFDMLRALLTAFDQLQTEHDLRGLKAFFEEFQGSTTQALLTKLTEHSKPQLRAASAELLFTLSPDPLARYKALEGIPQPEVTWAMLNALAQNPPKDEPLRHLEVFQNHRYNATFAIQTISAAGFWRAYVAASSAQEAPPESEGEPSG
ncbi:MAG: HEAT repeat domain-containing protein [Myxococcota bacterium]